MKHPIFLISTEGKSREQIKAEAAAAFLRYKADQARAERTGRSQDA